MSIISVGITADFVLFENFLIFLILYTNVFICKKNKVLYKNMTILVDPN